MSDTSDTSDKGVSGISDTRSAKGASGASGASGTGKVLVGVIMGSASDHEAMLACERQLQDFGIGFELIVASAHRSPARVHEWAASAHARGLKVIIAAAGKAAHLAGVVAAYTPLPVIAVPMKTSDLGGLDSLLSMVQMPTGVPVATVAINGAANAAILAAQIIGTGDPALLERVIAFKDALAAPV
jgi:5-(carboxyamino)imidazole ribonucleotide mutase